MIVQGALNALLPIHQPERPLWPLLAQRANCWRTAHEVLEAATVAVEYPPLSVVEFNEGAFERAAQAAHARSGIASPASLHQMLAEFGFRG